MDNWKRVSAGVGLGDWHVRQTFAGRRPVFGACTVAQGRSDREEDALCVLATPDGQICWVGVLIRPDTREPPLVPRNVRYCLSAGDWHRELENDPTIEGVAAVPSESGKGVVYMTAETEQFDKDVRAAIVEHGEHAQVRIGILERYGFSRNSGFFSFFRLDGLAQVTRTLPAYHFGGHSLLFD
ncbi:MAG: hypothetical protein OXQ29_11955 [Rhodospirillaceae bacterium]|nr:hypothetical protein [Rhodospirillaceae bacterium]